MRGEMLGLVGWIELQSPLGSSKPGQGHLYCKVFVPVFRGPCHLPQTSNDVGGRYTGTNRSTTTSSHQASGGQHRDSALANPPLILESVPSCLICAPPMATQKMVQLSAHCDTCTLGLFCLALVMGYFATPETLSGMPHNAGS